MEFKIINKQAIHIILNDERLLELISILEGDRTNNSVKIVFDKPLKYGGKQLLGLEFIETEDGENVSFLDKFLHFEIEHEMYEDLLVVLERAIAEKGFRTPEIMQFHAKSNADCAVTLYAIYNELKNH
jgi:hypothetical protein